MGKIIAFSNQKGGVGKTTTCVNLSAYLAAMGQKILIVDLDPQGNATSGIGIDKHNKPKTIYNVVDGDAQIEEVILHTYLENLDIIPSTVDLAGIEIGIVQKPAREKILKNILSKIQDNYDFILIDCPPSLGLLTVNALTAADTILIPIQCEFYALEGLSQLMNTIRLVKHHLNNSLDVEGVVLTMMDGRSNLIAQVGSEILKFFGKKVFETSIPRSIRLAEAPSHGQAILTYDFNSKGANAYLLFAEEFLTRNKIEFQKLLKENIKLRKKEESSSVDVDLKESKK